MKNFFPDVIERMWFASNLKNASDIAKVLNVSPQAISNCKKRGTLPSTLIIKFADVYGLSVDWLLWGKGDIYRSRFQGEASVPAVAAESSRSYEWKSSLGSPVFKALGILTSDELIYVDKLLRALRLAGDDMKKIIEYLLDSMSTDTGLPPETEQQS